MREDMNCLKNDARGADLLVGFLEGTLRTDEREQLVAHAAGCAECRDLLAVQAQMVEYAPEVSRDFDAKLYARIAREPTRSWWKIFVPVLAVAAMLAVVVFVQRPDEEKVVTQDVLQLEQALEDLELLKGETI
jgi:hypothetical protein